MALSEPFDILAGFPGWTTKFELMLRQEQSRITNGVTITKTLGSPLWTLAAVSKVLKPGDLDDWRARLDSLGATQQTFLGYALSKVWPRAYPRGTWAAGSGFNGNNATLSAIASDRKTIRVGGLPSGFKLSVGDLIRIGASDLHRVREAATASGGTTGDFEVFPNLWPGVTTSTAVSLVRPYCLMRVMPGSVSSQADPQTGRGAVSFQGVEAR